MSRSRVDLPDTHVAGTLTAETMVPSLGCVNDNHIQANAGIAASKLEHRFALILSQNGTCVYERRVVALGYGATGDILSFQAGCAVSLPAGDSTVACRVKKNGSNILTTAVVLNSSSVLRTPQEGAFSTDDIVADDVLEIEIEPTAGTGTLPSGVFTQLVFNEDAS